MAAREQYKRGILQIHEDDIGVGCLESFYGIGEDFLGIVGDATPDRIVATELPDHQIRPVTQDIVFKAGNVVRDVLHNAPAVDQLDPRGGAQSDQLLLHDIGKGALAFRSPKPVVEDDPSAIFSV